jgi:hypothetical protein
MPEFGIDHQHVREVDAAGERREVLERVVAHLHHVRRDRQRPDRAEQDHRAVGGPLATSWWAMLPPAPALLSTTTLWPMLSPSFLGDQAGGGIGRAAGREADHHR